MVDSAKTEDVARLKHNIRAWKKPCEVSIAFQNSTELAIIKVFQPYKEFTNQLCQAAQSLSQAVMGKSSVSHANFYRRFVIVTRQVVSGSPVH